MGLPFFRAGCHDKGMGNKEYRDDRGHFVDKANNGAECWHGEAQRINEAHGKLPRDLFGDIDIESDEYRKWSDEADAVEKKHGLFRHGGTWDAPPREVGDFVVKESFEKGRTYFEIRRKSSPSWLFHTIEAESVQDAIPKFLEEEEDGRKEAEAEEAREKAERAARDVFRKKSDEEKLSAIESGGIDPGDVLDGDPITQGVRVGGYSGRSMSNSAKASEDAGSMPKSRWTKQAILDEIEFDGQLSFLLPKLREMPLQRLKEIALERDGWHHTGKFYSKTDFYRIASPRDIAESYLAGRRLTNGIKKGLGV